MLEEIAKTIPTYVSRAPSARLLCFEKVLQWMRGSNLSLLDGGYRKLAGLQGLDIPSKHSPYDPFRQFLLTTSKFNGKWIRGTFDESCVCANSSHVRELVSPSGKSQG